MLARFGIIFAIVSAIGTACTDLSSFTNLVTDGPPAIAEVRLKETYTTSTSTAFLPRRVFGFGTFPDAPTELDHPVTTAAVSGQSLRIIMDEILIGNSLEQVQCRAPINAAGAFSSVPLGATPDDIALCSVNTDAIKAACHGEHAVCICAIATGCGSVAVGDPVGVLDINNDGAADNTSFMPGAVGLSCGGVVVPIDLDQSYWNPSGDQQVPAMGGYDALGPAIVLVPTGGTLPSNSTCDLTFAANVTDKKGNRVCTPPAGRPADCTGAIEDCAAELKCTPGDVSAFSFKSEALRLTVLGIVDGGSGVDGTMPISVNANAPLAAASLANITFSPAATFTISQPNASQIKFTFTTPLTAATTYTITFPTTVTDSFGIGLPATKTITFTTA